MIGLSLVTLCHFSFPVSLPPCSTHVSFWEFTSLSQVALWPGWDSDSGHKKQVWPATGLHCLGHSDWWSDGQSTAAVLGAPSPGLWLELLAPIFQKKIFLER